MQMITNYAMKAGFCGGVVIDYPNSTKAKKYGSFLLLVFWVVSFDVFDGHNLHVRRPFAFTMATLTLTLFLFFGGGARLCTGPSCVWLQVLLCQCRRPRGMQWRRDLWLPRRQISRRPALNPAGRRESGATRQTTKAATGSSRRRKGDASSMANSESPPKCAMLLAPHPGSVSSAAAVL